MSANIDAAKECIDKGPPWIGESGFKAKETVKAAGGKWHADTKQWKAVDLQGLVALINTGVWLPCDISPRVALCVVEVVKHREKDKEAEAERARKKAELAKAARQDAFNKSSARSDLMIPPNEQSLLDAAYSHGITDAMIDDSGTWGMLGPRSGISDINRLHRGVNLNIVTWEEIRSGAAAIRNKSSSSNKRTGGGQAGQAGVKRGEGKVRGDTGHTSLGKRQMSGRSAAAEAPASICDCGGGTRSTEQGKLQKHVEHDMPKKKPHVPITYIYTASCPTCGMKLDSREQFGLECNCGIWARCNRCFIPLREGTYCKGCIPLMV